MVDISQFSDMAWTTPDAIRTDKAFAPHQNQLADFIARGKGCQAKSFDMLEFAALAPGICIVDVEQDPERFKFRFIGSDIVSLYGRDNTGRYLDELQDELGPAYDRNVRLFQAIVESGKPIQHSTTFDWVDRGFVHLHAIDTPLFDDNGKVVQILCVLTFEKQ